MIEKIKNFLMEIIKKIDWKKILYYFISFVAGGIVALSITFSICNRRINRADTEIAVLRDELQDARTEVERAGNTISEIRRVQSEITDGLGQSNEELHSVIEGLISIRDKVQNIEHLLNNYYADSNSNNYLYNN